MCFLFPKAIILTLNSWRMKHASLRCTFENFHITVSYSCLLFPTCYLRYKFIFAHGILKNKYMGLTSQSQVCFVSVFRHKYVLSPLSMYLILPLRFISYSFARWLDDEAQGSGDLMYWCWWIVVLSYDGLGQWRHARICQAFLWGYKKFKRRKIYSHVIKVIL